MKLEQIKYDEKEKSLEENTRKKLLYGFDESQFKKSNESNCHLKIKWS